jgi:phosphoglycolate phosphatase
LHFAPEKGIYTALLKHVESENYIVADLDPRKYSFAERCLKIDLCNLDDQPSCEYDLILHSHVLEHTPCNIAYTLFHLHRMLKENGRHVCIIPFMGGKYDECFQDLSREERQRRFGQFDHVRRFGKEDVSSHLGKIINLPPCFDATKDFDIKSLCDANIPENHWGGFGIGTVVNLRKSDFRLQT